MPLFFFEIITTVIIIFIVSIGNIKISIIFEKLFLLFSFDVFQSLHLYIYIGNI